VLTALSQKNEAKLKNAGAAAHVEKASLDLEQNADALIQIVEKLPGRTATKSGSSSG